MKTTFIAPRLLGLAALVFAATLQAQRTTFDNTKTRQALPLDTPPVIDGVADPGEWDQAYTSDWQTIYDANLEDGVRGGNLGDVKGPITGGPDLGFQIWAGYDSTNLYIRFRVTDDVMSSDTVEADSANGTFWVDDAVEVFIDGDNSNNDTRNTDLYVDAGKASTNSFQFAMTANNGYFEWQTYVNAAEPSAYGVDKAWFAKASPLADGTGYDVEFRISLAAIGNPKPGDVIGFNVAVDDDDDGGEIERQVHWSGLPHIEAGWGNLLLGRRSYEAPKTAAPTINGIIAPGEYAGATEIKIDAHTGIWDIGSGDDEFPPDDNGYSAWVVHDADAVYVAIDLLDDQVSSDTAAAGSEDQSTWEDDSVEIFFDVDLDRSGGRETAFEGQYVFTANGAWRDNEAGNPTFGSANDWFAATSTTAGGYQVEFKIMKSALNNPSDGATLGFHIAQNDDDGSGRRAQLGWSGRAHNESTYGTLKLLASGPSGPTPVAESSGSISAPAVVNFGALSGSASYEFVFTAVKGGASTAIAGDNAWAIKLDQWNQQGIFGTTQFGVADNVFVAVAGQSVASVFARRVHVVVVSDTAAKETRLYIDGVRVGTWAGNFLMSGDVKVMGARLTQETDHMGAGSVMDRWATYQGALTDADVVKLAAAWPSAGTISIARSATGVTITFQGTLQQADNVTGPFTDMAGVTSPADLPVAGSMKCYRSRQ